MAICVVTTWRGLCSPWSLDASWLKGHDLPTGELFPENVSGFLNKFKQRIMRSDSVVERRGRGDQGGPERSGEGEAGRQEEEMKSRGKRKEVGRRGGEGRRGGRRSREEERGGGAGRSCAAGQSGTTCQGCRQTSISIRNLGKAVGATAHQDSSRFFQTCSRAMPSFPDKNPQHWSLNPGPHPLHKGSTTKSQPLLPFCLCFV